MRPEHIERLHKRAAHLRQRIEASPRELSYDKAELNALELAIAEIERCRTYEALLQETLQPGAYCLGSTLARRIEDALRRTAP